jgi:polysaccharide deacetylase 2 family uncharacterized protein YibQ
MCSELMSLQDIIVLKIRRICAKEENMQITNEKLGELLAQASETGVRRALSQLGLDDEAASKDMTELRQLLSAWRDAKSTARKAAIGWVVKTALALLLIGIAVKLGLTQLVLK